MASGILIMLFCRIEVVRVNYVTKNSLSSMERLFGKGVTRYSA